MLTDYNYQQAMKGRTRIKTILSMGRAKQLYEELDEATHKKRFLGAESQATISENLFGFVVVLYTRKCRTGGVLIKATIPDPLSTVKKVFTRRLRPCWTEEQFITATNTLYIKVWLETQRQHKLKYLQKAVEKKMESVGKTNFLEAVNEIKEKEQITDLYDKMLPSVIDRWFELIHEME